MHRLALSLTAFLLAALLAGQRADACGFHSYIPEETTVDKLLGSEHIVLARQSDSSPFEFAAVEAIRGPLDGIEIPHLVDSATRMKLAANPGDRVLYAREGAYGPWQRLAYVDAAFRPILDQIADRLEPWSYGDDRARFQFFADLLGHPDPVIRRLAMAELDRAPYELLSTLRLEPDVPALLRDIWALANVNTLPIRVLLLGLSEDAAARSFLADQFKAGQSPGGPFAGAFAVALIESAGEAGVDILVDLLRKRPDLAPDVRESLIEALAIQSGVGAPELQRSLRDGVSTLLWLDPTLAGPVARQFGQRADWSQQDALTEVAAMGAVPTQADLINVSQYLSIAREVQGH